MSRSRALTCALVASALAPSCAVYSWPAHGQDQFPFEWPAYRHDAFRTGDLPGADLLSRPAAVHSLAVDWAFPAGSNHVGLFRSSPIAVNGRVYIGSKAGIFYALDASSGALLWQYPVMGRPLTGSCDNPPTTQAFGNYGIQSSASFARIDGRDAVVFGAPDPDPSVDDGLGSARLWALDAVTGTLIWKSDVVARFTSCTSSPDDPVTGPLHERITNSSPLIVGSTIYVGIHNDGDRPIQKGKVKAVNLTDGRIIPGFSYAATSTRGGGVWNSPASDGGAVYFTTGNTKAWNGGDQEDPETKGGFNDGLSLMRVNPATGDVGWKFQPVPFALDADPDWSAGAAVMSATCGELIVSVQKDGWTYAVDAADGSCAWQFPPMGHPRCIFPSTDALPHGDTRFQQPAAVWGDVLVIKMGGQALIQDGETAGYTRLHALNACADDAHRVRWIFDVPNATPRAPYSIGAPTITHGIVYVTTDQGHVVALADPSVCPAQGYRCSHDEFGPPSPTWPTDCVKAGYSVVPVPSKLADVTLPPGAGRAAGLRNEPALAINKVFVGTENGNVYALGTRSRAGSERIRERGERQCPSDP
jgi:outer membrane protein assembly factor BamB